MMKKPRILWADDMVRVYLEAYLEWFEEAGFKIDVAVTVVEAFNFLSKAEHGYDLLMWEITDQPLGAEPGSLLEKAAAFHPVHRYGELVYRRFRELYPGKPVVLFTTHGTALHHLLVEDKTVSVFCKRDELPSEMVTELKRILSLP